MADNEIHVEIDLFDVGRERERISGFVEEIRQVRPDLVYTWGTSVTSGVAGTVDGLDPERHVTDLPLIFTMVADPLGAGIVEDLTGSGRNVTGTVFLAPLKAQLRTIEEYFGDLRSIGVIYNPKERNSVLNIDALQRMSDEGGFELIVRPVPLTAKQKPDPATIPQLVKQIAEAGAQALYIGPDSFLAVHADTLTNVAIEFRLATFAATENPLRKSRAMMGLVSNYFTLGQFVAFKSLRLLRGEIRPGDSPINTLSRFSFMLNLDVVRAIDRYPPLTMLRYAVLTGGNGNDAEPEKADERARLEAGMNKRANHPARNLFLGRASAVDANKTTDFGIAAELAVRLIAERSAPVDSAIGTSRDRSDGRPIVSRQ
jgi:putative ABC transport system substrate-binding protein